MKSSEAFYQKTKKSYLYNITPIQNVPSIIEHGILCYDKASKINHTSIAMDSVQQKRDKVRIPHGMRLHQYANLYFTYHNPMLYKRQNQAEDLCILAITIEVLDYEGCIVTDRNAATSLVKFYSPKKGIAQIDFEMVFAKNWNHPDPNQLSNHRAMKCAEVLIPQRVPFEAIQGAYVVSKEAEEKLLHTGFDKRIVINPSIFYR